MDKTSLPILIPVGNFFEFWLQISADDWDKNNLEHRAYAISYSAGYEDGKQVAEVSNG